MRHPFPAEDFSSPHSWPTRAHTPLDLNGIAAFRRYETRSGWASPLSRGGGVLPTSRASPVSACRFPAASPSPSLPQPVCEGSSDETSTEIHTINPSDLSLARGPRTEREPFGVSLGLRTPPLPATHAKAGTGLTDTDPELHPRHQSNLPTASPLTTCDLASHCPLYSGATVLTQPTKPLRLPLPLLRGQPCTPAFLPSSKAPYNEASSGVHSRSPTHPSLRLWPPDGTATLRLFPRLRTHSYP